MSQGGTLFTFPTVEWPASDPLVTGVGGTYLCTDPTATTNQPRTTDSKPGGIGAKCSSTSPFNTSLAPEVAWTFSGGGFSHVFSRPSYQAGASGGQHHDPGVRAWRAGHRVPGQRRHGGARLPVPPPDGSTSNVNQTGWYDIGGTSLSCPQWAGLVAIADQINKAKYGQLGLGQINPALYKLAANPSQYSADFFDIAQTGDAAHPNNNQGDPSVPGYHGDERVGSGDGSRHAECGAADPGSRRRRTQLVRRSRPFWVGAPRGAFTHSVPSSGGT